MCTRFSEVAEELIAEELLVTDGIRWATSDRGRLVLDTILVRMLSSVS